MSRIVRTAAVALLAFAVASCSDINKQESPVTLVVTNTQKLFHIDIAPTAPNCNQALGQVTTQAIQIGAPNTGNPSNPPAGFNPPSTTPADLNQVTLTRYEVSWVRLDGGHLVPSPVVRSTSGLITVGASTQLSDLVVFTADTLNQAPFAALLPQNGGVDPETGKRTITMDAVITVFGQTLAGEAVSGTTHLTLDFCYSCGGCS